MYKQRYDRNDSSYPKHEHSIQYDSYIKSPEWQQKREVRFWIDRNTCQMCGTDRNLEVHHLCSYRKLGSEDVYHDLVTVCHDCHQKIHRMMGRITSADGRRGWREVKDS